jgi:medium-chain acyl-[acyl-carrier-protein] hydrolase
MAEKSISSWVMQVKSCPLASVRLFCIPYAGASAAIFRNWVERLAPYVEVVPIHLPGRAKRMVETPFRNMEPLVESLAYGLAPWLKKPFAFFGHSMGATISFELAHKIQDIFGLKPLHLFVSGRAAPQIPCCQQPIACLPEEEFIQKLEALGGTPREVLEDAELLRLVLMPLRADCELIESYEYIEKNKLECPITAFGGRADKDVTTKDLDAWREQTSSTFRLRLFKGDHFFLRTAETQLLSVMLDQLGRGEKGKHSIINSSQA